MYGSDRRHKLSSRVIETRHWRRIFYLKGAGTYIHTYIGMRSECEKRFSCVCRGDDDAMMGDGGGGFEEGGHDDEDDMYHWFFLPQQVILKCMYECMYVCVVIMLIFSCLQQFRWNGLSWNDYKQCKCRRRFCGVEEWWDGRLGWLPAPLLNLGWARLNYHNWLAT